MQLRSHRDNKFVLFLRFTHTKKYNRFCSSWLRTDTDVDLLFVYFYMHAIDNLTTLSNGSLGSRNDEERREVRYVL